jgi:hypothetical protein
MLATRRCIAVLLLAVESCAGGAGGPTSTPGAASPATKPRRDGVSYPGFDKRDFPGTRELEIWYATSPYEWVSYYLPSPCFAGAAWTGHRQELIDGHWGLALLYVGLQARSAAALSDSASPTNAAGQAPATRCSQNTLSADQGRIDADDAVDIAAADGFTSGTTIFLDVERAEPYPTELDAYVRSWVAQVLARKYTPGIYGHRINAAALFATQKSAYTAAGDSRQPPFWIVNSQGFDLGKAPAESGFPFATVWQNPTNAKETYGGVAFQIDRNVASIKSPSP